MWLWLPRAVANAKLTDCESFFSRAVRSLSDVIGESPFTANTTYSRARMLSGVKSV